MARIEIMTKDLGTDDVKTTGKISAITRPAFISALVAFSAPILLFAVQYAITRLEGGFDFPAINWLGQSLGTRALEADTWANLRATHVQPPGLNALYAVLINSPLGVQISFVSVFYLATLTTVVLIVAILRNLGFSNLLASVAGCIFAVLPTTTLYALWPYNTALVAFLGCLSIWSFSIIKIRPVLGILTWCLSALGLFLLRPSFVWFAVLMWLIVPVFFVSGKMKRLAISAAVTSTLVVLMVQGYYLAHFGLITTSSWSGQNVVKALVTSESVTPDDLRLAARGDPCLLAIANAPRFFDQGSGPYDVCPGGFEELAKSAPVLQQHTKIDGSIQYNTLRELQLASQWNELARNLVVDNPLAPLKMAFGNGSQWSSFEIMFGPGYVYSPLVKNLVSGGPVMEAMRPLGFVFPAFSMMTIAFGAAFVIRRPQVSDWTRWTFWVATAFLVYSVSVGLLFEWGENQRFLAEVYPILTIATAIVLSVTLQSPRPTPATNYATDHPAGRRPRGNLHP